MFPFHRHHNNPSSPRPKHGELAYGYGGRSSRSRESRDDEQYGGQESQVGGRSPRHSHSHHQLSRQEDSCDPQNVLRAKEKILLSSLSESSIDNHLDDNSKRLGSNKLRQPHIAALQSQHIAEHAVRDCDELQKHLLRARAQPLHHQIVEIHEAPSPKTIDRSGGRHQFQRSNCVDEVSKPDVGTNHNLQDETTFSELKNRLKKLDSICVDNEYQDLIDNNNPIVQKETGTKTHNDQLVSKSDRDVSLSKQQSATMNGWFYRPKVVVHVSNEAGRGFGTREETALLNTLREIKEARERRSSLKGGDGQSEGDRPKRKDSEEKEKKSEDSKEEKDETCLEKGESEIIESGDRSFKDETGAELGGSDMEDKPETGLDGGGNENNDVRAGLPRGSVPLGLRSPGIEPISESVAAALKKVVLGSATGSFAQQWLNQSFVFNSNRKLKYGFVQTKGGSCAVLASVQAFLLKTLLFEDLCSCSDPPRPTSNEVRTALIKAITEVLWRASTDHIATLVVSSGSVFLNGSSRFCPDGITETLNVLTFTSRATLEQGVHQHIDQLTTPGAAGCLLVVLSAVLCRGVDNVAKDMDEPTPLIGSGGQCPLELVNLFLIGCAVSNVHDNSVQVDLCVLRGVHTRADVGFLSIYEHYNSCKVGSYLKTPRFPIWLVYSEEHFTVLFSCRKELVSDWRAEKKFQLFYYDGMARQKDEIKLTIDTTALQTKTKDSKRMVPPLEHCIRTKWRGAVVDWGGSKPFF